MANQPSVHFTFFAKRHIPLLTKLRYDYGMSYDTGEVDEDGNMIFRGKSLKGFAYVVQDSVVVLLSDVELFIIIVVVFFLLF